MVEKQLIILFPKNLYTQVRQVLAIIKHIEKDCGLFKMNETVKQILNDIAIFKERFNAHYK